LTREQPPRWLSDELGLQFEPQDSGIVNADGARLGEFAAFLDEHELASTQVFELLELLLASANERLLDDPGAHLAAVDAALSRQPGEAEYMAYWASLGDPEEFPIAVWTRARRTP